MHKYKEFKVSSDVAFTEAVKSIQTARGSRQAYSRMEQSGGWSTEIDDELKGFIENQTSVFLATANVAGQPYIQHRGGPPGFLRVLDAETIAFADFRGNRQYITLGNLTENSQIHLFLIDYMRKSRVKIWGHARVVDDPTLMEELTPEGYNAKPEQSIVIQVVAWDSNCPQHIPQRFEAEDVKRALEQRDKRIAALETELASLRGNT